MSPNAAGPNMTRRGTVIVGAGPAGLACALRLKQLGYGDVLVVEKRRFPRYKCCAGYITGKTLNEYRSLGLDPEACHYSFINDFSLVRGGKVRQRIDNKFLYTNAQIDRVELDHEFFRHARASGIEILEDTAAVECDPERNVLVLRTASGEKRELSYEKLVFADGMLSVGARLGRGHSRRQRKNIALQHIFKSGLADGIEIWFGVTRRGYVWVSTLNGLTNVGMTDVYDPKVNYRELFASFLETRGLSGCFPEGIAQGLSGLKAAFEPIGVRQAVYGDNICFAGDALGACDPVTLSGLRYALKSGKLCAESIAADNFGRLRRYAFSLRCRFGLTALFQRLFYLRPMQFLVFNVGTKCFGGIIRLGFNSFLTKK